MSRPRKLTIGQVEAAAIDRRSGMSWKQLSLKYKCAVNTLRTALAEYSDEFNPIRPVRRSELETEIEKIKQALKKRFNLHV